MKLPINILAICFALFFVSLNAQTIHYTSSNQDFESGIATYTYYIDQDTFLVIKDGQIEYSDDKNSLSITGFYKKNKKDGKWEFRMGNRIIYGEFSNDKLIGSWNFSEEDRTRVIATKFFDQIPISKNMSLVELSKELKALILKR